MKTSVFDASYIERLFLSVVLD